MKLELIHKKCLILAAHKIEGLQFSPAARSVNKFKCSSTWDKMHLKKVLRYSYNYLIATGRIDSLHRVQDGRCLFLSDAVIFGTGIFNTQGA